MNSHTRTDSSPTEPLKILQLNTRRCSAVIHSLLNDPLTLPFHFLLLQEPYIYPHSNLPITHLAWVPFYPDISSLPTATSPEDTTIKSIIYVNRRIPTTALATTPTLSNCITAVQYTSGAHTFTLTSAYAPPKQAHKLHPLCRLLQTRPPTLTNHILIGMDCNVHHPLWNPETYSHTHREAEDLISMMAESGLSLSLQCGVPTFYSPNLNHTNTTIDLTWVSPACADWITACETDIAHNHSHLSDHVAILTRIDPPCPVTSRKRTFRNWKRMDQPAFEADLGPRLANLLPTLENPATDQASLDHHTDLLVRELTAVMDTHAPRTPVKATSKRWWNRESLDPLKTKAQQLLRLYQRRRTPSTKQSYIEAAQAFRTAIHDAKRDHWRSFLATLTPSTLFTAASFATADWAAPSLAVPPLRQPH